MVTERREGYPYRDAQEGGIAARFRPLAGGGDSSNGTTPPSNGAAPPEFATVPWGYKRAEVDSWASWVGALVAHGRNETVRADSAEATLKATLQRLEQLRHQPPNGDRPATPESTSATGLPRRGAPAATPADRPAAPPPAAERPADPPPAAGRVDPPPAAGRVDPPPAPTADAGDRDRPELARLQVVERTLHEVMTLLHRLVGPDERGAPPQ